MDQSLVKTNSKVECNKRWNAMRSEFFNGWNGSFLDLSTYVDQKRGWFDTRPNRGFMINHQIILDSYATSANETLASGLLSGMTSPSRPWFRLMLDDVSLNNVPGVRAWLDEVQKRMVQVMNKSNIYSTFYSAYEELGQFGTSCFLILDDFDSVIRCRSFTGGEYWLGQDSRGRVNAFGRYFWMTVGQLVKEFGLESCSPQVQMQWKNNLPDVWIKVAHLIEPNETRIPMMNDFKNMPYRSVYWEFGNGTDQFLATRGYKTFPVIATRWKLTIADQIYGVGPGWYALGDIKQLQKTVLDMLLAQEKSHRPPMIQDSNVEGSSNLLPGGITKSTSNLPNTGLRPAYQIQYNEQSFINQIDRLYGRIDKYFHSDIFRMVMGENLKNVTAEAIAAQKQEQIMLMGPILYKLQEELLDPTMELIFSIMIDMNMFPPPPQQIAGMPLKVKYISILAQAQQALGVEQINRVIGFVAQGAQIAPQMIDIIDWDEAVREVAEFEGTNSKLILDPDKIQEIRDEHAAQLKNQQMMQGIAAAESAGKTAKNLAQAPMDTDNALTRIVPKKQ